MMNKKGATTQYGIILILAIFVLGILYFAGVFEKTPVQVIPPGAPTPTVTLCDSATSPSLDIITVDIENKGTAVTAGCSYKVDGGLIRYDGDCLNIPLNPGESIEYLANDTGWYSVKGTYTVECKEDPSVDVLMKQHATGASIQFYCEDDGLLNAAGTTESIAASEEPKILTKLIGQTEKYVQDPTFICEYDKTYFSPDKFNAGAYTKISTPDHFSANSTDFNDGTRAWAIKTDLAGGDIVEFITTVDATTTDPVTAAPIFCYLDDHDWFINEDDGTFEYGASDEASADVGMDAGLINVTLHVA